MKAVIVDGNRKDQFELHRILESGKIRVVAALSNGQELLSWLESHPRGADMVLMEILLPVLDGYACFCELQSRKLDIPVVFVTRENSADVKKSLLAKGAKGYITKPLSREKVLTEILTRNGYFSE